MNGDEGRPAADEDAGGRPSWFSSTSGDDRNDRRSDRTAESNVSSEPSRSDSTERSDGSSVPPSNVADGSDATFLSHLLKAQGGWLLFLREVLSSVLAVAAIGMLLFAVSGVWPPMVAVESGSMEPHMYKGDLVFITEPGRYMPERTVAETGVVPLAVGEDIGYRTFGDYGSVIVFDNPAVGGSPIIHRAHFWVENGENWYDRADPDYVRADNCAELTYCPAPHAGFITKGDNNARYDQASDISGPVSDEWVTGVARVRVPLLGWIRLSISSVAPVDPVRSNAGGVAATANVSDGRAATSEALDWPTTAPDAKATRPLSPSAASGAV